MVPKKLIQFGNRPVYSASWGGFNIVPSAGYIIEADDYTGSCELILVESTGITTQSFANREAATVHLLNLIRLKSLTEQEPDENQFLENERILWDELI